MFNEPDAGHAFAAVDLELCAASNADIANLPPTLSTSATTLATADHRVWTFWNTQEGALDPKMSDQFIAGECTRGWVTFVLPADETITEVHFDLGGGLIDGAPILTWAVP